MPKFSGTPGKIWRGSVPVGHDNALVYDTLLGFTASERDTLQRKSVI